MEKESITPETPLAQPIPNPVPEQSSSTSYGKKGWKKWLVVYVIIAAILYGAVYYLFLSKRNTSLYSDSSTKPTQTQTTENKTTTETQNMDCKSITIKNNKDYQSCTDGKDNQLVLSGKVLLSRLSKYLLSPDKQKLAIWQYEDYYYESCVLKSGCGGGERDWLYMVDLNSGTVTQLTEMESGVSKPTEVEPGTILSQDEKLSDGIWSSDNSGLLAVWGTAVKYCSNECKIIATDACGGGWENCPGAFFSKGSIYYHAGTEGELKSVSFKQN